MWIVGQMKYDVLILGGGFAGAYCARALGRALGPQANQRVALVAERNVLVFHPMLAEVAGGTLSPLDVVNPLRHFCRHVDVLQGAVKRIDWEAGTVIVDGGRFSRNHVISFGHLVVGIGNTTDLSRMPGMQEFGLPMKNTADAIRIRVAILNRLEEANLVDDEALRARLLTFVIVGGGYTGVETAGQVQDLILGARRYYSNLRDKPIRVILLHSRAHLLEEIGQQLGDHAAKVLQRRGMEIILNARVEEATSHGIFYNGGRFLEAHTIIASIGSAPSPVVLDLCQQLGLKADRGRIPTEATMQVPGTRTLWAAGDCAAVPWSDKGESKTSPPTAQFALRQGSQLGANVLRALRNEPLKPFTYRYMGQLATVGAREAVAEVMGFHFSGFVAWIMWRTIYLAKLPGIARRLRVMIDWTFELIFPRDLSVPLPAPEDPILPVHFAEGELLVERGEPCQAFLYVRKGSVEGTAPGQTPQTFPAGSLIDQRTVDEEGRWRLTLRAMESTDAVVFRGPLLEELVRSGLRLASVPAALPPHG